MALYFFNIHDGADLPDEVGTELPDLRAVRAQAVRSSGEILRDYSAAQFEHLDWKMTVTDEAGRVVFMLRFSAGEPDAYMTGDDKSATPSRGAPH